MARMFPQVRELLQTAEGRAVLYGVNVMAFRNVSTTLRHPGSEFKLC
jgi:hypothetical protein